MLKASPVLHSVKSVVTGICSPKTQVLPLPTCARSDRAESGAHAGGASSGPAVWTDNRLHFKDADGVVYRAANASRKQGPVAPPPVLQCSAVSSTNGVAFYDLSPRRDSAACDSTVAASPPPLPAM